MRRRFGRIGIESQRAAEELREIGLGGTAVGTGLNAPPGYRTRIVEELSRITNQPLRATGDYFEAMQSMSPFVAMSSALRTLATDIIRITNDLRLLSSGPNTGLAEINLPAVQPGSSIMPGKVNPVIAEMSAMVCFQVMGNDLAIALAAQAGQLELNVMMPVIAFNLLMSLTMLTNALAALRAMRRGHHRERRAMRVVCRAQRCAGDCTQSENRLCASGRDRETGYRGWNDDS